MAGQDYTVTITRKAAREAGLKRYFTGTPCKHGHIAERLEINGSCCECARLKRLAAYHANIEEERRKQKIRRDSDPDHNTKQRARRYAKDADLAARVADRELEARARAAAKVAGDYYYLSRRPCANSHLGYRFVRDGKCTECNRIYCHERAEAIALANPRLMEFRRTKGERAAKIVVVREKRVAQAKPWREAHEARKAALRDSALTYKGKPCPHGHDGLRYTKGGCCVECLAIHAASPEKKAYDAIYGLRNRDRIRARTTKYYERTREARSQAAARWTKRNPEKRRTISAAYNARRRAKEAKGDSTAAIHEWKMSAPKKCYWCGVRCPRGYHVDHYVPLAKGGRHEISNLVIACRWCNLKKSAKDPYDFAATVGRLF